MTKHPELSGELAAIESTLVLPDVHAKDATHPHRECFYRLGAATRYPRLYVKVCVEFDQQASGATPGFIVTAHVTHRLKQQEVVLWNR